MTGRAVAGIEESDPEAKQKLPEAIPLRLMGAPAVQLRRYSFLASARAAFITGAILDVNGGRWMA